MIIGYTRMKAFLRRSAGLDIDKSDMDRLSELIGRKLNDLLVIGVRNAGYNNWDIVMEPDLPLTKGLLEHLQAFRRYEEGINLQPILYHLATYPPLERSLSLEVEAVLPEIVGTLAMLAGQAMKTIDPEVKNPGGELWDQVFQLAGGLRRQVAPAILPRLGRLNALLDSARASISATDYSHRITTDGYLHQTARRHATEIRAIVESTAGRTVSDDEFWQFLKVIHVLSFDLNTSTAQTEVWVKTLLAYTTVDQDKVGAATASWRELLELVGSAMPTAGSSTRDQLPESLRQRHSGIGSAEQTALQALKDHSATIFNGIHDSVGDTLVIRRDQLVTQLLERLEEDCVVVVSGPAGHGKSVLGNHAVEILHRDHSSFAFRAEEFATSHLDGTLHRAQVGVGAERLLALLAGQGRKLLMVESVERLLEASVRDAFSDLLALAKHDQSWRIILTCRDYSIDVVRSSFLEHAGLPHAVVSIPQLTDEELNQAVDAFPKLRRPATNAMLRRLFHRPYLLDKAARMQWPEDQPLPQDERSFRRKVWRELVRRIIATCMRCRYSKPLRLKTNAEVRSAGLRILDQLVDSGSSAAYRVRDDFVTPIAHQNA